MPVQSGCGKLAKEINSACPVIIDNPELLTIWNLVTEYVQVIPAREKI